jgi:hypothetical protein
MNLFERLDQGRPTPSPLLLPSSAARKPSPAQLLLNWIQRWPKPVVSWRDIHNYGPGPTRDQKNAINATEILVRNGWLRPMKAHRYDMHKWEIIRKPLADPTIMTEAGE